MPALTEQEEFGIKQTVIGSYQNCSNIRVAVDNYCVDHGIDQSADVYNLVLDIINNL